MLYNGSYLNEVHFMSQHPFSNALIDAFEDAAKQVHRHYIDGHNLAKTTFLRFLHNEQAGCDFETYSDIKRHREKAVMKDKGSSHVRDISNFLSVAYYDVEFENKYIISPILSFIDKNYLNGMFFSYPLNGFEVTIEADPEEDYDMFWKQAFEAISEDETYTKLHQTVNDKETIESLVSLGFVHFFESFPFKQ